MIENIHIRSLRESDLPAADRILRLAFGTFMGLSDPMKFFGDADYVRTRFLANPSAALAAEINCELVGSNFVTDWGSVGFFGPLSVRPDLWGQGVAKRLVESTINLFDKWGTKHMGLFTFSHSPKHVGLYQKFDFWPWFLTAIMSKPVVATSALADKIKIPFTPPSSTIRHENGLYWSKYSELLDESQEKECLTACRALTDAIYVGLDLTQEITAVKFQGLGDTLLLWDRNDDDSLLQQHAIKKRRLLGLAVCHCGAGSEAGSNTCYIKVGAVQLGHDAGKFFIHLLNICEELAREKGMSRLVAGVNTGRIEAYRKMMEYGFRTDMQGVVMHRNNEPGYNRFDVYFIDDWR
jgi:GNAT superfamily N-acetyltransferase